MIKKVVSFMLCVILAIGACIGITACSKNTSLQTDEITQQEVIDQIVDNALKETDSKIDDYIDVSYFVNLAKNNTENANSVKTLADYSLYSDEDSIKKEQFEALTSSMESIFSELTNEEYSALKDLAKDDADIADMLQMVESDFAGFDYDDEVSGVAACSAVLEIGSLLLAQGVGQAAIIAIKGAFNTMITTLKIFFLPNTVKAVLVTAAILVIATVVIINWNKIKAVFNKVVNIFVDNAKKLATTVVNIFNTIYSMAVATVTVVYSSIDDVINNDKDLKNRLSNLKKSINDVKNVIKIFLGINDLSKLYDSNDKVLCLGRDQAKTYNNPNDINGYQNYAEKFGYWKFFVSDFSNKVEQFGQDLIEYANIILVNYCCFANWDFILVTNPYYYMEEHLDIKNFGGKAYANEISLIRKRGYNTFLVGPASWSLIPCPGRDEGSYYAFAGYKVSK